MKLILSTSNIMSGGPSVIRRHTFEKSNTELTSSLRANFTAHRSSPPTPTTNGAPNSPTSFKSWTTQQDNALWIPTHTPSPLSEPRDSYDITVKLFYLPNVPADTRCLQTREAIDLVLKELGTSSIDLLIVSFPGISFDADDEDSDLDDPPSAPASDIDAGDGEGAPEDMDTIATTWHTLEKLHEEGLPSTYRLPATPNTPRTAHPPRLLYVLDVLHNTNIFSPSLPHPKGNPPTHPPASPRPLQGYSVPMDTASSHKGDAPFSQTLQMRRIPLQMSHLNSDPGREPRHRVAALR
ncbi:hypothetical protein GRF29_44g527226 [Pseudopithomyces chartarum]|uniref:GCS light chain n=1 Tax=Pseudopithomyces chartarum TaxID=1892770 RepID=A0AAN6M1X7_9PLEO|nr:hypothetical protein GRF29_44g527226 [Pseudopithomyces chartarum]